MTHRHNIELKRVKEEAQSSYKNWKGKKKSTKFFENLCSKEEILSSEVTFSKNMKSSYLFFLFQL